MADNGAGAGAGAGAGGSGADGGAAAGAGAGAGAGKTGADDGGTSLLDPSHDNGKGGDGGGSSSADADAAKKAAADKAAADAAAKAGGKGDASKKGGEGSATGAPESYTDFKMPDGWAIDPSLATDFKTVAKELNLPQESAQKLVDIQMKAVMKGIEQKEKEFSEMKKGWEAETLKQLGTTYQAERALAAKGRDMFVTPELQKLLNQSGLGSHPEVFKMFARLGKAIAEDTLADGKNDGGGAGGAVKPTSEVLFGKTTPPKK